MSARSSTEFKPLPWWKQRRNASLAAWQRSADRRRRRVAALRKAGRKAVTLAISGSGAILVSYGAWMIYAPAGYLAGGLILWAIQWNYGDEGGGE